MPQEIEIENIKRVNREGRYYDRVTFKTENSKEVYYHLWRKNLTTTQKKNYYKTIIKNKESQSDIKNIVENKKKQINPTSPKRIRTQGYYQTSIKLSMIVRYKNQTPFFFPQKGRSNFWIRASNVSEQNILRNILQSDYTAFKMWLERWKKDKNIYIYYGWTYRRVFSATGSFNGDSRYLDFIERKFYGRRMKTINRFEKFRKQDTTPPLRLVQNG